MATRLGEPSDAVELSHDGHTLTAQRGELLAFSLIAADRLLLSRSPKLHRPRGPYCLRGACEGCLVRVDGVPNQAACRTFVRGGEQIETQNVLGTRETDLLAAADFLFPHGVDHHRLLAGVRGLSPIVSAFARRVAGLGSYADHAVAVHPAEELKSEVLIVGGGTAGLLAATALGSRATLVDDGPELGGSLCALQPAQARARAQQARQAGATLLERTSAISLSREPLQDTGVLRALLVGPELTRVATCQAILLATGRHDRTPDFPNNDLPGIFSARAALLAWQNDVLVGNRLALVGSGRFASRIAEDLAGAVEILRLDEGDIVRAIGRERITGVELKPTEGGTRRIKVSALAFDGPGAPSFELSVQGGGSLVHAPDAGYFPVADDDGRVAERLYVAGGLVRDRDTETSVARACLAIRRALGPD